MKKVLFFATLIMSMLVISCSKLPKDIQLGDKLTAYAELGENNDTLWGVKDSCGTVIKPYHYQNWSFDGRVITCKNPKDELVYAFTEKGTLIGKFEIFSHWGTKEADYYLGVKYKDKVFYFPKTGEIIQATDAFYGFSYLFLEVGDRGVIYTYTGKKVWTFPTQDAIVFLEKGQETYYILAPEDWNKPPFAVYDVEGKLITKMPNQKYHKLIKSAKALTAFKKIAFVESKNILK